MEAHRAGPERSVHIGETEGMTSIFLFFKHAALPTVPLRRRAMAAERRAGAGPLAIVLTARGVEPDVWL
jgi:hypothetical protein